MTEQAAGDWRTMLARARRRLGLSREQLAALARRLRFDDPRL